MALQFPVIGPSTVTYVGKDGKKHHAVSIGINFLSTESEADNIAFLGFSFVGNQYVLDPYSLGPGITSLKFQSMQFVAGFQTPQTQVDSDSEFFIFSPSSMQLIKLACPKTPPDPPSSTGDLTPQLSGCIPIVSNVMGKIILAKAVNSSAGDVYGYIQATFFDEELPAWTTSGYAENFLT